MFLPPHAQCIYTHHQNESVHFIKEMLPSVVQYFNVIVSLIFEKHSLDSSRPQRNQISFFYKKYVRQTKAETKTGLKHELSIPPMSTKNSLKRKYIF